MLPLKQFQEFINQHKLFTSGNKILLAVSGGKDSILMLHLFKALGVNIGVAHCNFNLRADEATRDEHFVKMLSASLNLSFHLTQFDTKKYAAEHKISTQMAARELRYQWFEEIRVQHGYDYIALAQHQNDAVETVLINLVRGTGISGLHGILPKRDKLIRPLLFLTRAEINALVDEHDISFVEDSSNLSTNYTRNKIRLDVIPHLQQINPNLEHTFEQNINRFSQLEEFLILSVKRLSLQIVQHKKDGIYIAIKDIDALEPQNLLLFELLKPYHFTDQVVADLISNLHKQSGLKFLSATHQAIIDRDFLIISKLDDGFHQHKMIHQQETDFYFGDYHFSLNFSNEINFMTDKRVVYVDAQNLVFPMVMRNWQNGDKFIPLGMQNFKKLSDFFIDEKVPLHLKGKIPILINGNGDIIWIAGFRQDNRYKLTKATKKVAIFEVKIK
ncbi:MULTISPECIES: tRNA lysidine(34) synthetase TilS [unclassified Pedobacter]|uniref:tRNA lysidine(34) synthetase TilS n=1 Tax=unclassified Pedobacter TaxID=2628915 RepID=UPI001E4CA10C|nr:MULTISPECIES: tRNA lysidine(34) synthetase TilS [unclassified Pedobacter]